MILIRGSLEDLIPKGRSSLKVSRLHLSVISHWYLYVDCARFHLHIVLLIATRHFNLAVRVGVCVVSLCYTRFASFPLHEQAFLSFFSGFFSPFKDERYFPFHISFSAISFDPTTTSTSTQNGKYWGRFKCFILSLTSFAECPLTVNFYPGHYQVFTRRWPPFDRPCLIWSSFDCPCRIKCKRGVIS